MKLISTSCILATLCLGLLSSCTQEPNDFGSLSMSEVHDALQSPQIAVTPMMPGWLLEPKDIHLLTHEDKLKLVDIASRGIVREIPAEYYDNPEAGNRKDDSRQLFYLYASDAQCLGCRVIKGNRILIDDLDLKRSDTKKLYTLLIPYVSKMSAQMTPEQKTAASAVAAEKAYQRIKEDRQRKAQQQAEKLTPAPAPAPAASAPAATPATPPTQA
ncbi:MAG: hypothetical protein R3Y56_10290 [Akkermansia sp.]